jgi:hypothetical protein
LCCVPTVYLEGEKSLRYHRRGSLGTEERNSD